MWRQEGFIICRQRTTIGIAVDEHLGKRQHCIVFSYGCLERARRVMTVLDHRRFVVLGGDCIVGEVIEDDKLDVCYVNAVDVVEG